MTAKNQGFVLITILIFVLLINTIVYYLLENYISRVRQTKIINDFDLASMQVNNLLLQLNENNLNFNKCKIINDEQLVLQPKAWWISHACVINFKNNIGYYVIKDFGENPCVFANKNKLAHFYRISMSTYYGNSRAFKQDDFVTAVVTHSICRNKIAVVNVGLQ